MKRTVLLAIAAAVAVALPWLVHKGFLHLTGTVVRTETHEAGR